MKNLSIIKPKNQTPHDALIETLEDMLEKAKNGEIQSFSGVTTKPDGTWNVCRAGKSSYVWMIGALQCCIQEIWDESNSHAKD